MGHAEKSDMELTTLICPKCGYEQEERLDCLKCGIVFSKFHALHIAEKVPQAETMEVPPIPLAPSDEGSSFDLAELRQQVRDLSRQLTAVEFERVERSQLRTDMRTLDKKVQSVIDGLTQRLETLERSANEPPAPPPASVQPDRAELVEELKATHLDLIHQRLDLIESKLEKLAGDSEPQTDPWVLESLGKLDQRIGNLEERVQGLFESSPPPDLSGALEDLQNRLQTLKSELDAVQSAADLSKEHITQISDLKDQTLQIRQRLDLCETTLEQATRYPSGEPSRERIEADVRSIRESLEQIREFIVRLDLKS
jgi:chromosome segregation ATPase